MAGLQSPVHKGRFYILAIGLLLFWVILEVNLFRFQIINFERLSSFARKQYEREVTLEAQRGTIFDRSGNKLATNVIYYDIAADPVLVKNKSFIARTLAGSFSKPVDYYLKKMNRNSNFAYLERRTTAESIKPLLNFQDPGLIRFENFGRYYPYGSGAAQVLGFTDPDDNGLSGLELQFEESLKGKNGKAILQYDAVRGVSFNADYPLLKPAAGLNYYLTLDKDIQTIVEKELKKRVDNLKAKSGIALVMDPTTGAVLAMANYPEFNPNNHKKYEEWIKKNRAIMDVFEPGSTMKMFTSAALLQERHKTADDIVFCENGRMKIYDHHINDTKKYGWLSFKRVVENSSNIGMVKLTEKLPSNILFRYLKNFGFGSTTEIGLLGESGGTLTPPSKWSGLSKAVISIGQEMGVTALQITTAFSALVNGGYLYKPYIVSHAEDLNNGQWFALSEPERVRQVISPEVADILKDFMRGAVLTGTGKKAHVDFLTVGGKTGTAQKFNTKTGRYFADKYVASFIGFAPYENPEYVCAVFIDEPVNHHYGGDAAAPVFAEIIKQIAHFNYSEPNIQNTELKTLQYAQKINSLPPLEGFNLSPTINYLENKDFDVEVNGNGSFVKSIAMKEETIILESTDGNVEMDRMPDLRGLTLRQALKQMDFSRISVVIEGSGRVYNQSLLSGTSLKTKKQVVLSLR
jgi:cell division protein FtsI/penicillin-binding protein 2